MVVLHAVQIPVCHSVLSHVIVSSIDGARNIVLSKGFQFSRMGLAQQGIGHSLVDGTVLQQVCIGQLKHGVCGKILGWLGAAVLPVFLQGLVSRGSLDHIHAVGGSYLLPCPP